MRKNLKPIPHFRSGKAEREFWQTVDSTEYVDYSRARRVSFPNLKFTSRPITIRLPQTLIDKVKIKAHRRDIPYQSLIKQWIFQGAASVL
jgi:predicted DNA binding CopG/RHH family protein